MMIDITQLFGQPALSLASSERTGTVQGLRFEGNRVVSIDIGDGRTIPTEAVRTFEGEALTYTDSAVTPPTSGTTDTTMGHADEDDSPNSGHAQRQAAEPRVLAGELPLPVAAAIHPWWGNPIGTLLLSDIGDALGTLSAMSIDADGVVAEVVNDRGHTYTGDRIVTVGSFATIISTDETRPEG